MKNRLANVSAHHWRPAHAAIQAPRHIRPWLKDTGSLTKRFQQVSHGHFQVELLRQHIDRPHICEARALGIKPHLHCLVREVLLKGANQPWVYARSIIPLTTLKGRLLRFKNLANRSLGELLFKDPSIQRRAMQYSAFKSLTIAEMTYKNNWARRSVFLLGGKPLLVNEVFLQGFSETLTTYHNTHNI